MKSLSDSRAECARDRQRSAKTQKLNSFPHHTSNIESLGERLADVASQMRELPQPEFEEMQALMSKHGKRMQQFQGEASAQLMKLAKYPELMEAYTKAVANTR